MARIEIQFIYSVRRQQSIASKHNSSPGEGSRHRDRQRIFDPHSHAIRISDFLKKHYRRILTGLNNKIRVRSPQVLP
jgi:hypothetical protein